MKRSRSRFLEQTGLGTFGLIVWTGLLAFLLLALELQVASLAYSAGALDSQFYSFVLAENGLEFARSMMQALEAEQLIAGRDGLTEETRRSGWRNPLSFERARRLGPDDGSFLTPDDGLPWDPETGLSRARLRFASGQAIIRFSNNPEEPPGRDRDGVLLVRSMGVAETVAPFAGYFDSGWKNQVTLLEARLQHSRYFQSPAPLTLWQSEALFEGDPGLIGGKGVLIACVDVRGPAVARRIERLRDELTDYLDDPANEIRDLTSEFSEHEHRRALLERDFWQSWTSRLPEFLDARVDSRLHFKPSGGTLSGAWEGLIVSRSELTLESDFRHSGLLLHIGPGDLRLSRGSQVSGAIWKITEAPGEPGRVVVEDGARIEFDETAVREAMRILPADLLGFRVIFPEMRQ